MFDLDDIIEEIQEEKLERARTNPIRIIGNPSDTKAWVDFYSRFWATEEGQEHLRWMAEKRSDEMRLIHAGGPRL